MRNGLVGILIIVLIAAFILQNVYVGGLGGLLLLVLLIMVLTGRS